MVKLSIRYPVLKDAKPFLDIITNPRFRYLHLPAQTVKAEEKWLRSLPEKRKSNQEWNYAIIYGRKLIGGIGIKIDSHRPYIGEIGYFIAEEYWGRGLASRAVKLVEREAFKKLKLRRLEIVMRPENKASEKVAIKNDYRKEGKLKKFGKDRQGVWRDFWLYAKVL